MHRKLWLLLLLIPLLAAAAAWLELQRYARTPTAAAAAPQVVEIPAGQDFRTLTGRLQEAGLIRSPSKLRLLARLEGFDRIIQAGEYELSATMAPRAILEILASGKVRLHRLTIPEGFTLGQVADAVAGTELATRDAFYAAATDPGFARQLEIPADTFEGYLFPDTYHFPRDTTPRKIITTMVAHFRGALAPEWQVQMETLGWTLHQVVILASIIEKETGAAFERPLISSVFHNRLGKGMRLESDPTVIYGIPEFDGNLTRKHLRTPTPYNTYQIPGLPPGPIANP
ncbi:MAG: endolytic transglycosylase MltG, partial [Desulfobacterales bacterium]